MNSFVICKITSQINKMNTKEQIAPKEPMRSFLQEGKEPVISRIAKLVERYPSRRQAAEAWGLNYSTLQNYFKRADEEPNPRRKVLESISRVEGVTIEWLLTGIGSEEMHGKMGGESEQLRVHKKPIATISDSAEQSIARIADLLRLLKGDDLLNLASMLGLKGIETLLYLLDEDNIKLLKLDRVVKDAILGKHYPNNGVQVENNDKQGRECGHASGTEIAPESLASGKRKAV